MTSAGSGTLLLLAGVLAGVVGTAGGITSLVSYPALLAVGVPALPATVANMVSGVACWPASGLMSRRELAGSGQWLARGLPVAAAGAAAGAGLLLTTPPGVFTRVVPFLIAAASVVLLAQPLLTAPRRRDRRRPGTTLVGVGVLSIYSGYFGAGSGIMLLALLLTLVDDRMPEANAGKNMLLGAGWVFLFVQLHLADVYVVQEIPGKGLKLVCGLYQPSQHRVRVDLEHPRRAPDTYAFGQARQHTHHQLHRHTLTMKDGAEGLQKGAATGDAQQLAPGAPIGMAVGAEIAPAHPAAIGTIRIGAEMR